MKERTISANPKKPLEEDMVIPVIEEEVQVSSRRVERSTILINKEIRTEDVSIDVPEISEHYTIERIKKNELLDEKPQIRYEGDSIIIPVIREVVVKRILLTEEIRLTREIREVQRKETVNLKKEEVTVTRNENENMSKQEL